MNLQSPSLLIAPLALCSLFIATSAHAGDTHGPTFSDESTLLDFERVDDLASAKLGGVAWMDYDDDGDLDLYLVNSPGGDNGLYRNDNGSFTDVADEAGVTGDGLGYTGALAGDIDNDGCTDLFITGAGAFFGISIPHRLYMNNCDGTFTDATATSGIDPMHLGMMATFGDIDDDGYLDLFVASPGNFSTGVLTTQKLYRNNGDGSFQDISSSAGIATAEGACVAAFSDFNDDGWSDILVGSCNALDTSGDAPAPIPGPWELWINQGDMRFIDMADEAGLNEHEGFPMAIALSDYDRDGDIDIFSTGAGVANPFGAEGNLSEQVLFENNGDGTYSEVTAEVGLSGFEFGWGATFADFDNDMDDDLVKVGSVAVSFMQLLGDLASPGRVFVNDGSGNMSAELDFGLQFQATSGLGVADYDLDGYPDIVIQKTAYALTDTPFGTIAGDGRPVLLRNDGGYNRSVTVRLVGEQSNAMGIGARVTAHLTGRDPQTREVLAGSSFASTDSPWLTFGIGGLHWAAVEVEWPSGQHEYFIVTIYGDQVTDLEEGTGIALQ
ncbi:MAG: CRTAC1 family protein [Myxococcota bacterium]